MSPQRERRPSPGAPPEGSSRHQAASPGSQSTVSGSTVDLLGHALAYARAGLDVLPLTPGGKTPLGTLVPHGKDAATHDVEQVRDWWVQRPDANIGIRPALGLVVLDVDPRNGGASALVELTRPHGGLSPTWTAYTGGGGLHAWYRAAGPLRARLCDGADLKHHAGYVVAPPSLHSSGKRYCWGNDLPIAEAPAWLAAMMAAPPPRPLPRVSGSLFSGANDDGLIRLVAAPGGDRHNRLYWATLRAVEEGRLTLELRGRLVAAAASLGEDEAQRTIECAIVRPVSA